MEVILPQQAPEDVLRIGRRLWILAHLLPTNLHILLLLLIDPLAGIFLPRFIHLFFLDDIGVFLGSKDGLESILLLSLIPIGENIGVCSNVAASELMVLALVIGDCRSEALAQL